jgi:glutamate racemase
VAALDAPIGVFDSGVGGLTVARRILQLLPDERIVYVADQAHVPYGGRELSEVRGFAGGISAALFDHGCKAVVMACNISSAVALEDVRAAHPDRTVLGMIAPGACRAARTTKNGRIGVLATAGTVQSGAYSRALHSLNAALTVVEVACPAFVPLVEAGEEASEAALRASEEYLAPIRRIGADTIILGCTHYPFLLGALTSVWSGPVYVDPAEQTSRELAEQLASTVPAARTSDPSEARHLLTTTGDPAAFERHLHRFLPEALPASRLAPAVWQQGRLTLAPVA